MVVAELGGGLSHALLQMSSATAMDEKVLGEFLSKKSSGFLQDDVQFEMAQNMLANTKKVVDELASGHRKRRINQEAMFDELFSMLGSGKPTFVRKKGKPYVIMFVGLQGSGKTAICSKYAYHYQKKGWKPALVSADTVRPGAFSQLKQSAENAKIPFYGSHTETDAVKLAQEGVDNFKKQDTDLIIVDISGGHKQEPSLFEDMRQVAEATEPDHVIFIVDSSIQQAACDQAQGLKLSAGGEAVVFVNNHAKGGGTLTRVLPTANIGTGTDPRDSLETSLLEEVDQQPTQMGVCKESTTPDACPAPGSADIEQDDDEDDDDDDDDDDEEEEDEDYDNKVAAGDEEEDLEADEEEGDEEEGEDDGEAEDNGEGEDGDEEGEEEDVDGDEDGDEEQEEEDDENGDQDPEDEDDEEAEESEGDVEDEEPPKKKRK